MEEKYAPPCYSGREKYLGRTSTFRTGLTAALLLTCRHPASICCSQRCIRHRHGLAAAGADGKGRRGSTVKAVLVPLHRATPVTLRAALPVFWMAVVSVEVVAAGTDPNGRETGLKAITGAGGATTVNVLVATTS